MKNINALLLFTLLLAACQPDSPSLGTGVADEDIDYDRKTQSARTEAYSPEEQLASFTVPEGFVVELVASEREGIFNPIDLSFDDAGRLWTQTAVMYPLDPITNLAWNDLLALMEDERAQEENPAFQRTLQLYRGEIPGEDKILILSNLYGNDKVKVQTWAEGMAHPQSMLPYKNGAFVAQGSEYFFLEDSDGDGKADKRTPLLTGFGITDSHTMTHTLLRGPGGWVHFSHGALNKGKVRSLVSDDTERMDYSKIARVSLDGSDIELLNAGLNNIWGFQLRANGQWYATEANDLGYSIVPLEPGAAFPGIGNERLRPYQPFMPKLHEFRVGGTGISALAFSDDSAGSFPEEWRDVAILANPITSRLNAVRIKREADGSVTAEHLPDLLHSDDDWFRPVNMEFGPDGCLYIADWYNKIISHNELPTTHPDRDRGHGRIWRICHESTVRRSLGKGGQIPNFYEVSTTELPGYLTSPSFWARQAAWHQISDRPIEETRALAPELLSKATDPAIDKDARIAALWSLEGIGHYDKTLMEELLASPLPNLRREAVRAMASFSLDAQAIAAALQKLINDPNPMIRSQVIRTLEEVGTANAETIDLLVTACRPAMEGNEMGGSYERALERYLARKALESFPEELSSFLNSPLAKKHDVANLIWASQALPRNEREQVFVELWKQVDYDELDAPTFILVADMLGNPKVYQAVRPVLQQTGQAQSHVALALENQAWVQSEELSRLMEKPVGSLLQSQDKTLQQLGLEATAKLQIDNVGDKVVALITDDASPETLALIMRALEADPGQHKAVFARLASNESLPDALRTTAILDFARSDPAQAKSLLIEWMPEKTELEQEAIIQSLSATREGSVLLKGLLQQGTLDYYAFDLSSAEKVHQADTTDPMGINLLLAVRTRVEEEKKDFDDKLARFMAVAERSGGNAANGKNLFQTCLQCHRVGDEGFDLAPALDGSAERENEALLTAILDPDAALESNYALYRLTKKDGVSAEGFLVKKDDRGTTLGFMGGAEKFFPTGDIKSEGFIGGRSFMMKGLIDHYSDEQVADLLAYIRTLE